MVTGQTKNNKKPNKTKIKDENKNISALPQKKKKKRRKKKNKKPEGVDWEERRKEKGKRRTWSREGTDSWDEMDGVLPEGGGAIGVKSNDCEVRVSQS